MPKPKPALYVSELDAAMLYRLAGLERFCLAAVFLIVAANLAVWFIMPGGRMPLTGWPLIGAEADLAAVFGALHLDFSLAQRHTWIYRIGLLLDVAVILLCAAILAENLPHFPFGFDVTGSPLASAPLRFATRLSPQIAGGFVLFGITSFVIQIPKRTAILAADILTCVLVLVVATLASGQIIDSLQIFGSPADNGISTQATICLFLLTVVVFARKAQNGILSILAGSGTGSKLARVIFPILLLLPYVREVMRAHLINWRRMPPPYTTAFLATIAMIVSITLLLYLAWRINCMEVEIHGLSLRDELTGLYNLRGFRLLAEQAKRMADRAGDSFSVLFVDLDDLKRTNDQLGHDAGSQCLIETAEILKATFREADVMGRIGGDEFAVAGGFTQQAILSAAQRLEELADSRNANGDREAPLAFSIGHVTATADFRESLDSLLAKADQAMYREKRRKKILTA
jgi:diguanylate cyclase (GGDEF)-like protein